MRMFHNKIYFIISHIPDIIKNRYILCSCNHGKPLIYLFRHILHNISVTGMPSAQISGYSSLISNCRNIGYIKNLCLLPFSRLNMKPFKLHFAILNLPVLIKETIGDAITDGNESNLARILHKQY